MHMYLPQILFRKKNPLCQQQNPIALSARCNCILYKFSIKCCNILKLNQVTVDDEEGSHDSLTFQQLQTMLLEQFGENLFFFLWLSTSRNNLVTINCFLYKLQSWVIIFYISSKHIISLSYIFIGWYIQFMCSSDLNCWGYFCRWGSL